MKGAKRIVVRGVLLTAVVKVKGNKLVMLAILLLLSALVTACPPNALLSDVEQRVDTSKTQQVVATPQLSPSAPGGTYQSPTDMSSATGVLITCSTPGAVVHYTLDGSTPTVSTTTYSGPISVAGDQTRETIKAVATKSGMTDSVLAQETYYINYNHYAVYYNANGSTGGTAPVDTTAYVSGQQVTVLGAGSLVKAGNTFVGWNTAADGSGASYAPGAHFNIGTVNVNLYAQWLLVKLTASDGAASDRFGNSVATSSDGNTLIVGAYHKIVGGNSWQGAAYVFTKSGSTWNQAQELAASDGAAGDNFGYSVATSSDGNTLIVGAYRKTVGGNNIQGAAYVFTKSGSTWSQAQELTASDGAANDNFGYSVSASSDGSTLIVGAFQKAVGGNNSQGAAYVFTKSGSTWSQAQELTACDGAANDWFGISVSASSDGSTLVVGAYLKTFGGNSNQGAAYVFTKSGSWSQALRLTASDGEASDRFGGSVAVSSDGSTLIVGAYGKAVGGNSYQGAAYVFTKSGSTWSQTQELADSDGAANDNFGGSVAVSSDGSTLIVGAYAKIVGGNLYQGAACVFPKSGSTWNQTQELTASDGAGGDYFGWSESASSDGSTLIIGAYGKAVGGNSSQGAAYVFTKSGSTWVQQ